MTEGTSLRPIAEGAPSPEGAPVGDDARALASVQVVHLVGPQVVIILPGFVQGLVSELGYSDQQAGYAASGEIWGMTLATILMIFVARRVSWHSLFRVALWLVLAGNVASMFITDFNQLTAVRFLTGIGVGTIVALAYGLIGRTRNPDRNFGLAIMFALLYGVVVFPALPWVLDNAGLKGLLGFFAAYALLGLALVKWLPLGPGAAPDGPRVTPPNPIDWAVAAPALVAMAVFFIAMFAVWAYYFRMGLALGVPEQGVGNALSAAHVFGAVGAFAAAVLGARIGRASPLLLGILGCLLPLLLVLGPTASVLAFSVSVCVFHGFWNVVHPYLLALMSSLDRGGGQVVVYATAMQFIGIALGPMIAASVLGDGNYRTVVILGMLLLFATLVLVAVVLARIRSLERTAATAS